MNQSCHISHNYRVHLWHRYNLICLRCANLSTHSITTRESLASAPRCQEEAKHGRTWREMRRKRGEKILWNGEGQDTNLFAKGTDSEKGKRKAKKRRESLLRLLPPSFSSSSLPAILSNLSTVRGRLVEQIGTNDRRKAVKAEFIYAFPP